MPLKSTFGTIELPQTNLLTYLYSRPGGISDAPLWLDYKDNSKSLSTRQAVQWIKRLGLGLQRQGLKRGDVVLICSTNHIFVPVSYLGIVGSTCIFSGANPAYTVPELVHQLDNTTAKLILVHPSKLDEMLAAASKLNFPKSKIFQFDDQVHPTRNGVQDWSAMLASPSDADKWSWPELSPSEATKTIATINYSSGTTGLPKGVCISHANLIANVEQGIHTRYSSAQLQTGENLPHENWVAFLPLYHAFGQMFTILMATRLHNTVYVMPQFNYEEFLHTVQKYKIDSLQVAPPIIVMLCKRPETKKYDLSSLKTILCGAAPLKPELQNECQRRFGVLIRQGWGMTEVTCGGSQIPEGTSDPTGGVGYFHPNCEVKLLDEDGKEVGVGEPGELLIKGPNVCLGYWRNEEATRNTFDKDGFLKTGDVAIHDENGKFWIVDRKKELIKVNGLQVAPAELEAVLLENDHVADAACVGIDIGGSEWPRAYVALQENAKGKVSARDIQDWVASRVAKHKRLEGGVALVDEVPKLPSGKIVRKLMREWAKRDAVEIEKNATGAMAKAKL